MKNQSKQSKTIPRSPKPADSRFDARLMMELAVKVMRESVAENRGDGKIGPKVGAVLVKEDGTVETACRGELREGDHAEYTILERKNRDVRLDGAVLFVTLEPCGPGARNPPKIECAQRIVNARIKRVWIGITDPDPKVDRRGIKFLQHNGVAVQVFDRDLQEIIRQENEKFIFQAEDRARATKKTPRKIVLSELEEGESDITREELSSGALEEYRKRIGAKEKVDSPAFHQRLLAQGLLVREKGKSADALVPSGFAVLLFGRSPRDREPQAGVLGTIHYPDGREETKDFDGPGVLIPGEVESWLKPKLPMTLDRSRMQRRAEPDVPFELIREGVVNALVHRDYAIAGAKIHLVVTPDTIVIRSPGGPLPPITMDQMRSFNAPMLSRNPQMHYVFARMDLAEERGLGLKTLKSLPQKNGLPLPKFAFEDPYLVLTIYRRPESAAATLDQWIASQWNSDERRGWVFLSGRDAVTRSEYARGLDFDDRKAQRHFKKFVEFGLLRQKGSGPATTYRVVRD